MPRIQSILQLLVTLAILAFVPGNALKTTLLLIWWGFTFQRLSNSEWALGVVAGCIYTTMNGLSQQNGIFQFSEPDLLGQPLYEFLMWGFYFLHASRGLGAPRKQFSPLALIFCGCFALCFPLAGNATLLLLYTSIILGLTLWYFWDYQNLRYAAYFVLMGASIEYLGVGMGLWRYPGAPWGGVPLWFVTLWAGSGLYFRLLAQPYLFSAEMPETSFASKNSSYLDAEIQQG